MIGAKIREIRKSKNLSLEQAKKIIGIDKDYLARVEKNQHSLTTNMLIRIMAKMDITPNELLGQAVLEEKEAIKKRS